MSDISVETQGPIFTDTHCHIHEESYQEREAAFVRAHDSGVSRLICVGTDEKSSHEAAQFATSHDSIWASVGLHPHDATSGVEAVEELRQIIQQYPRQIVAVGECGLDYFYDNSPREQQIEMLHAQIELALESNLPMIFHVREAFNDFWPIFDEYKGLRGVLHSFTDNMSNLEKGLSHGLYVGINGIATFAKDKQDVYAAIPLENMLLETDAPYLTPKPYRGKINEPSFVVHVAEHIAGLRSLPLEEISRATQQNATDLFCLK